MATSLAFAQTPLSLGLQFSAGHPTLTITGTVGTVYSIQYASDLSPTNQWSELTQIQMQGVSASWTDPTTPTSDQRFYRALTLPATACPTHQYRFEEGAPDQPATGTGSVLDFVDGSGDGTPNGGPVYRADVGWTRVAACQCESNTLSLQLTAGQSVKVNSPFIFHNQYGDATLEFLVKPAQQPHHSLPTSDQAWQISGRSGLFFIGSVDEIRFSARKLDPSEFLISETICGP